MSKIILLDKPQEIIDRYQAQYQPAPYKPEWFDKELAKIGGLNPYGEPNFRVVWGMDEKTFRDGDPNAIKYLAADSDHLGRPSWILEEWWSAFRVGTFADWERNRYFFNEEGKKIDLIGEYPSRGMYWLFCLLENAEGKPSALTSSTLEYIQQLIKSRVDANTMTPEKYSQLMKAQRDWDNKQKETRKAQSNADWDEVLTKWDLGKAAVTRGYSITPR